MFGITSGKGRYQSLRRHCWWNLLLVIVLLPALHLPLLRIRISHLSNPLLAKLHFNRVFWSPWRPQGSCRLHWDAPAYQGAIMICFLGTMSRSYHDGPAFGDFTGVSWRPCQRRCARCWCSWPTPGSRGSPPPEKNPNWLQFCETKMFCIMLYLGLFLIYSNWIGAL